MMRPAVRGAALPQRQWQDVAGFPAAAAAMAVALGAGLAISPWAAAGATAGLLLLLAALAKPLPVLGLMLVIGPLDLSFMTGGLKGIDVVQGGLDMNGIRLVGITIALAVIATVDRNVLGHALSRSGRWYLLFLAWAAATLVMSDSPVDGLRLLLKLAYPFFIFIAVLGVARTRADLERLLDWTIAGAAVIALVLAPVFIMLGAYEMTIEGRLRIAGIGIHENPLSFYLLMMILVGFTRMVSRGELRYAVLILVLAAWMAATLTRITLLAGLTGLSAIALFHVLAGRRIRVAGAAAAVAVLLAVPLLPIALQRTFGYVPSAAELMAMAGDPVALFNAINWQGREIFWAAILSMFLENPITGQGLGSSTARIMANFPTHWGLVVHNEYLRLAAETGLVGVTLFAAAVGRWLVDAARAGRLDDRLVREYATPAFAGIVAWAVISITDNSFDYYAPFTQYIGFLCAGMLAAVRLAPAAEAPAGPQEDQAAFSGAGAS